MSAANTSVLTYLIIFICKLCEELQIFNLELSKANINEKYKLVVLIKKYSLILDYGQEVCDFTTVMFFAMHCLYAVATALTSAAAMIVSIHSYNNIFYNYVEA